MSQGIHVLVVEDNEADVALIQEAFIAYGGPVTLHVATSGPGALKFVEDANPRPRLVILDLNLPGMSGNEVLDRLKRDERTKDIPVVIFSSSGTQHDVRDSYYSQASGYVQKPIDLEEYFRVVANLERYWLDTVLLPK